MRVFTANVERLFLASERRRLGLNRWLRTIPPRWARRGGTDTLTEWAYTIGLFQGLFYRLLDGCDAPTVVDVGCGTGRLGFAVAPLLGNGRYIGIDVSRADLDLACRAHSQDSRMSFVHLDLVNRMYAPQARNSLTPYPTESNTVDLVTALSVWTHLNEEHGRYYLREAGRILRPGGHAVVTFFALDDRYNAFRQAPPVESGYSLRDPKRYIFDQSVDGSLDWLCPQWAVETPEFAIGVRMPALLNAIQGAGLELLEHHPGWWKERPGLFFQDVLVLKKAVG